MIKPRVGISACLLGERVRHNGGDKRNEWLVEVLGKFVKWVPICPEVEMGLGVPRPMMRLTGKPADPQMIVRGSEENVTALARETARKIMARKLALDSYIFKKDSPTCGLERVKIYGKNDSPSRSAVGLYAAVVRETYPEIPMIEEGRLTDPAQRELYAVRLFAITELRSLPLQVSAIQQFHQSYKLLLMAHAPSRYQAVGRVAANQRNLRGGELREEYQAVFLEALGQAPTRSQWINVLQHMFGYFKNTVSAGERRQVLDTMEEYRRGEVPLIAPLVLIRHLADRQGVGYLQGQRVFRPYPRELRVLAA